MLKFDIIKNYIINVIMFFLSIYYISNSNIILSMGIFGGNIIEFFLNKGVKI